MWKIIVKYDTCIGCGACITSSNNFKMRNGKAHPRKKFVPKLGTNKTAKEICPVNAIKFIKE